MSELAFNMNGEPFEVPATATGWRVRRMKHKGAPEVVYSREGTPLVLPIDATVDDLRDAVGASGRFRVDPVDGHRPIPNAPAGYVFVHDGDAPVATATAPRAELPAPSDHVVIEAMRMNAEIARTNAEITKSVVERFPQMMEAAATLLRAADGAGLPARPPIALDSEDEDDEYDDGGGEEKPSGFDFTAVLAQLAPFAISALMGSKVKLPTNLSALFDWRKAAPAEPSAALAAAPAASRSSSPASDATADETATEEEAASDALPPLDPKAMSHFIAIQSALKPDEAALARQIAAELSPAEMRAWFAELSALSVPDAVAKIRAFVGSQAKKGGSQ